MKIVSKKRYKNLINDLREKREEINILREWLTKFKSYIIEKIGYYPYDTEHILYRLIDKLTEESFNKGKEKADKDLIYQNDAFEKHIEAQHKKIKELIKENNELYEYIKNHNFEKEMI